jgi:hypothetical protein
MRAKAAGRRSGRTAVQGPASEAARYQRPERSTQVDFVATSTNTSLSVLAAYRRSPSGSGR